MFGSSAFSSDDPSRPTKQRGTNVLNSDRQSRGGKYGLKHLTPGHAGTRNQFSSMITSQHHPEHGDSESQKDILAHDATAIMMTSTMEVVSTAEVESIYDRPGSSDSDSKKGPEIRIQETS